MLHGYGTKVLYDFILDNPYDTEESLTEGIRMVIELPKPRQSLFHSLAYFPGYPLTDMALKDGFVKEEDLCIEYLAKSTRDNFYYTPTILPLNKKNALQNILWLCINYPQDRTAKIAVNGLSVFSFLCITYLNLSAIFLGKIKLTKRKISILQIYIKSGFRLLVSGQFRELFGKIAKRIIPSH